MVESCRRGRGVLRAVASWLSPSRHVPWQVDERDAAVADFLHELVQGGRLPVFVASSVKGTSRTASKPTSRLHLEREAMEKRGEASEKQREPAAAKAAAGFSRPAAARHSSENGTPLKSRRPQKQKKPWKKGKARLPSSFTGIHFKGHPDDKTKKFKNVKYLRDQKARSAYLRHVRKAEKAEESSGTSSFHPSFGDEKEYEDLEIDQLIDPLRAVVAKKHEADDEHAEERKDVAPQYFAGKSVNRQGADESSTSRYQIPADQTNRNETGRKQRAAVADASTEELAKPGSLREKVAVKKTVASEYLEVSGSEQRKPWKEGYVPFKKALAQARAKKQEQEEVIRSREERWKERKELRRKSKKKRVGERKLAMQRTKRGQIVMGSVVERLLKKGTFVK